MNVTLLKKTTPVEQESHGDEPVMYSGLQAYGNCLEQVQREELNVCFTAFFSTLVSKSVHPICTFGV